MKNLTVAVMIFFSSNGLFASFDWNEKILTYLQSVNLWKTRIKSEVSFGYSGTKSGVAECRVQAMKGDKSPPSYSEVKGLTKIKLNPTAELNAGDGKFIDYAQRKITHGDFSLFLQASTQQLFLKVVDSQTSLTKWYRVYIRSELQPEEDSDWCLALSKIELDIHSVEQDDIPIDVLVEKAFAKNSRIHTPRLRTQVRLTAYVNQEYCPTIYCREETVSENNPDETDVIITECPEVHPGQFKVRIDSMVEGERQQEWVLFGFSN